MTAKSDLEIAFTTIRDKRSQLDTLWNYYNGPQPLKYSTQKLAELFDNINTHFEMNWCSVVVDAVLNRLELEGFQVADDEATSKLLTELFTRLHIDIEADEAHEASLATSQAYMIIWKQDGETVAYYNDPRLCHVFYEDANPRNKRFAAKWFNLQDGRQELTLYYTDRIEHWISTKVQTGTSLDKASLFEQDSVEPNAFGVIPVFELKSKGEINKILTIQDSINLLFSDMLTTAEFGAIPQKYAISQSDPGNIKNAPNQWSWFPAGDGQGQPTSVGEFQAAQLSNFSNEMDNLANALFTQTSTPKHYLMGTGANISGEALLAMEAPLVKKTTKRQKTFGAQWQEIAAFIAKLEGKDVKPYQIKPLWKRAESVQPLTEMQIVQTATGAGIPLESALTRQGWSEKDVADIMKKKLAATRARVNSIRVPMPMEGQTNDNPAG